MRYILDDKNNVVLEPDFLKAGRWFELASNELKSDGLMRRAVARDELDGVWMVSTVFLGVDHNWGEGTPLLFETMIFVPDDAKDVPYRLDNWIQRYSTWQEAEAGHKEIVEHLLTNDLDWFDS